MESDEPYFEEMFTVSLSRSEWGNIRTALLDSSIKWRNKADAENSYRLRQINRKIASGRIDLLKRIRAVTS